MTLEGSDLEAMREMTKWEKEEDLKEIYIFRGRQSERRREGETKSENQIQEETERGRMWWQEKQDRMRMKEMRKEGMRDGEGGICTYECWRNENSKKERKRGQEEEKNKTERQAG